jgi:hypothetical protein
MVEARAMVIAALDEAAATGITHIARDNLYLNPVDAQGQIVARSGHQPLPHIDVPPRNRNAADEHELKPSLPCSLPLAVLIVPPARPVLLVSGLTCFSSHFRLWHMPVCFRDPMQ